MDKISVIIPVYNVEKYLGRCIESLISQTYKNIEVILVDDGSPDLSGEIMDSYAAKDSRIIAVHKENGGSSSARNRGLLEATGEYIAFVDADDYVKPDYLEVLYKNMTDDVDIVAAQAEYFYPDGTKETINSPSKDIKLIYSDVRNFMGPNRHFWVWGALFRRSVIGDLKFNESYHVGEDTLFYFTCLRRARAVRHIAERGYNYILYPQSACHGDFSERKYTEYYVWRDLTELYKDCPAARRVCRGELGKRSYKLNNTMRRSGVYDKKRQKELRSAMRRNYFCYMSLKGYKIKRKTRLRYTLYMFGGDILLDKLRHRR